MSGESDVSTSHTERLRLPQRFWRNRLFARARHRIARFRRPIGLLTRAHARLILLTDGRIRRSHVLAGGMSVLVLTTVGRRTGKLRSTPLAFLKWGDAFAVLASNAGNDHVPAWWLNLQAQPAASVLADRVRHEVTARKADPREDDEIWQVIKDLNPGFDEYRRLTARRLPVVLLEPRGGHRRRDSAA
ncbi:MAG: nitroreductase family deazaflavin-dependent oxidoreductase [Kutzneria sp.]|nr:nitroreductase family deazaflavin-dependent oxidoreductase [Kutzneria sp.]